MKCKVITSSNLGTDCWSTKRFIGECHICDRVQRCNLPEAKKGRIRIAKAKVFEAKNKLAIARNKLWELENA